VQLLGRLLRFVRPYWWGTLGSVALIFALSAFRLGPAWFVKLIIDNALPDKNLALAGWYIAGMLGVALVTTD
jgi:ABC-type multidrug transport system fused ATPase/permease subunit